MPRYRDIGTIGSGGFGEVYKVVRIEDGREFARKVLADPAPLDPSDVERFKREVRLLRTLNHPRIVKIIDSHVVKEPYWFVMPLFRGSLRDHVPAIRGDEARAREIVMQLLDAMEYAHANGVIHRDLKPENILCDDNGDIVVSDFGLGRRLESPSTRKTYTGQFLGTPFYMAPEQELDAKNADQRSDIYSVGRIIYEMYTGDPPSAQQDLTKLEAGIRHIVARCTRSEPNQRYQTIEELRRDFDLVAGGLVSKRLRDDVQGILATLVASEGGSPSEIDELHKALFPLRDDADLVHEVFMSMPPDVFAAYFEGYPDIVRDLTQRFAQHVSETGWPFQYCDKIADAIRRLFRATTDTDLHVSMLVALLELGVSHNRFHVMDVFAKLLGRIEDSGEVLAVRDALDSDRNRPRLAAMKDRLSGIALAEPIRTLVSEV
jgi:hypothetical protein